MTHSHDTHVVKRRITKCEHCGAPLVVRCGVRLTPRETEIFDALVRHGAMRRFVSLREAGITGNLGRARDHARHIREKFTDEGYWTVLGKKGNTDGGYMIVNRELQLKGS
jgi:hypothetical protein